VTSAAIVAKRFSRRHHSSICALRFPAFMSGDFSIIGGRVWRCFIESDLWPNLILSSAARRLPMVLINGRMSHRSFPRWRRVAGTISALLGRFDVCLAQSRCRMLNALRRWGSRQRHHHGQSEAGCSGAARRLRQAGTADVGDARPPDHRGRRRPIPAKKTFCLMRIGRLQDSSPSLLSVIVPRHPARGEAIARSVAASGLHVAPAFRGEELPTATTDIYVGGHHGGNGIVLPAGADRIHGRFR